MYRASENRYDTMPDNRLGNSGLKLSAVSLGLSNYDGKRTEQVLDNIKAAQNTEFTADELTQIEKICL